MRGWCNANLDEDLGTHSGAALGRVAVGTDSRSVVAVVAAKRMFKRVGRGAFEDNSETCQVDDVAKNKSIVHRR